MIKRYEVKEIVDIWSQENKLSTWKKAESSVTKSLEEEGIVPKGCLLYTSPSPRDIS